MRIDIRKAAEGDVQEMVSLLNSAWYETYREYLSLSDKEKYCDVGRRTQQLSEYIKNEGSYILLRDGKICGLLSQKECDDKSLFDCVEITQLYIDHAYRSLHYGKRLLSHVLCAMRKKGYKQAVLWCADENESAKGFYKKFGFEKYGKTQLCDVFEKPINTVRYRIEL